MSEGEPSRVPGRVQVGRSTRWYFGSGGLARGVITNANYFVLIYYNQVLDLSGSLAGLALAIGLAFDAVSVPLMARGQRELLLTATEFPTLRPRLETRSPRILSVPRA